MTGVLTRKGNLGTDTEGKTVWGTQTDNHLRPGREAWDSSFPHGPSGTSPAHTSISVPASNTGDDTFLLCEPLVCGSRGRLLGVAARPGHPLVKEKCAQHPAVLGTTRPCRHRSKTVLGMPFAWLQETPQCLSANCPTGHREKASVYSCLFTGRKLG